MQEPDSFALGGGLDLVTPAIEKKPGLIIAGVNHEPGPRGKGYRRIDGYERMDGRPKPSAANYWVLNFDAGTAAITEGQTVTGATSSATGKALIDAVVTSGSYGGGDAAGYLVLTGVSGTFADDENLQVSAATKCVADGEATERGAANDTDDATWIQDAIETARALIQKPTGSGPVRGVWLYDGVRYAFRNNTGGTAGVMYKATTAGWVACDLGRSVAFTSGGTTEIVEGDTVTGATSAATATVKRVIVTSGAWADGDAAGRLILYSQTGTFQAENLDVGASTNVATIAGNSAANALPAGGRYEFDTTNFGGAAGTIRMYGVNGVGPAFEWDGETFVPILTGMATDTPKHIQEHKKHLFLAFPNGSLQNSGIGDPYAWEPILGAAEIGLGDEITGMVSGFAGIMAVFGRNKTAILYGSSDDDWDLDVPSKEAGAIEWSLQRLTQPVYFDDQGIRNLTAVQQFGDFQASTLSWMIKPLLDRKKAGNAYVTASLRVKSKNQYRLYFSDGTGLVVDLSGKTPQIMELDYDKVVYCACSAEDADGSEVLLFGDDEGNVYQLDSGTSFDGAAVEAFIRLAFYHSRSPRQKKRYHRAILEIEGQTDTPIYGTAEFSYGDPEKAPAQEQAATIDGGGGFWDEAIWDAFLWDAPVVGSARVSIDGSGTSISLAIGSELTYEAPYTLQAVTLMRSFRGLAR